MKSILSFAIFFSSMVVQATIDSEAWVKVPYQPAQVFVGSFDDLAQNWHTEEWATARQYCFTDRMFFDTVSSSSYPLFVFLTRPYEIPVWPESENEDFVQANALADGKMQILFDWESLDQYSEEVINGNTVWIHLPEFKVDVTAYDQTTPAGRLQALVMAKLAVASLHANLVRNGTLFRAKIEILGLPEDQKEFVKAGFGPVFAKTKSRYSAGSPLVERYNDELFASEYCRD